MIPALSLLSYPQECPYGEGDVYYGFQNPYLLVYLPVSLGTASQRAQAPPGVACCPRPPPPGARLLLALEVESMAWVSPVFLLWRVLGKSGGGWRQALMGKKEVTFTHIWLSYGVSLALQWIELSCVSCPPIIF